MYLNLYLLAIQISNGRDEKGECCLIVGKFHRSQPKLYKMICQFFLSTMKLLSEPLDGPMCGFVLRRLRASIPLIGKKLKLARKVLMCALGFFGNEAKSPRVQAIMLIREMVLKLGDGMVQACMKVGAMMSVQVET